MDPGSDFVDGLMPEHWLSTCVLMWVPFARSDVEIAGMHKYWLIPRSGQPHTIDVLSSVLAVRTYLNGDLSKCRNFRFARSTYEALLALTDVATGIRDVTAANTRGDSPVIGRRITAVLPVPQPVPYQQQLKKVLRIPGIAEARAIVLLLPPSSSHAFFVVLPGGRRLEGLSDTFAYFEHWDGEAAAAGAAAAATLGVVVEGLYERLLPHADFARGHRVVMCSSSDGSNPAAYPSEAEAASGDGSDGAVAGLKRHRGRGMLSDDEDGGSSGRLSDSEDGDASRRTMRGSSKGGQLGAVRGLLSSLRSMAEGGEGGGATGLHAAFRSGSSCSDTDTGRSSASLEVAPGVTHAAHPAAVAAASGASQGLPSLEVEGEGGGGRGTSCSNASSDACMLAAASSSGPGRPSPWRRVAGSLFPSSSASSRRQEGTRQSTYSTADDTDAVDDSGRDATAAATPAAKAMSSQATAQTGGGPRASAGAVTDVAVPKLRRTIASVPAEVLVEAKLGSLRSPALAASQVAAASTACGSAGRGSVDPAAAALALAARMRERLAAILNEQLEEARQRRGPAAAHALQARSAAAAATAACVATTAAAAAAGKRVRAGREAEEDAARLSALAASAASAATRLADATAAEAVVARREADAFASAAADAAESAAAAQRAAKQAAARVRSLKAELAELTAEGSA